MYKHCSKIQGSIAPLPCGLTPVLDLTSGALLGYLHLPPQISNLCIKKMSIKIIPSKKYPHNKTKSSISWKHFVSQHAEIHSSGSASQRSLLNSVAKNCFPGSDFAAWANLSQVQPIRKSRLFPINKQEKQSKGQQWSLALPAGKVQEKTWTSVELESGGGEEIHSL